VKPCKRSTESSRQSGYLSVTHSVLSVSLQHICVCITTTFPVLGTFSSLRPAAYLNGHQVSCDSIICFYRIERKCIDGALYMARLRPDEDWEQMC
jgi:hypothetical protein